MRRLGILLLLLLICCGIYFLAEIKDKQEITTLRSERAFAMENIDKLYRIVITEKNKKSIILEKKEDDKWQLNNKYLARKNAVDNLLEVIKQVQIKYIPEPSAVKNIIAEMRTIGVQVDLYGQDNSLMKSYLVGGSTQDERGTYMLMNDEGNNRPQPFVMRIPSIEGSVRGRFILSETNWRDRSVINEELSDVKYIKVEYPENQNESFMIKLKEGEPVLFAQDDVIISGVDQNKVKGYTQLFDGIYAEYIDNLNPLRDSISALKPFSIISYGKSEADYKVVRLFPLSDILYERAEPQALNVTKVEGRYFVDCSWGDFMLVQHRLIGKLLRGRSFFELN